LSASTRVSDESVTTLASTDRIVVLEPSARGHRLYYVRQIIEAARALEREVILLTSRGVDRSTEFHQHLDSLWKSDAFALVDMPNLHREAIIEQFLPDVARSKDSVVVPDGDGWLRPFARSSRIPYSVDLLIMRAFAVDIHSLLASSLKAAFVARLLGKGVRATRLTGPPGTVDVGTSPVLRPLRAVNDPLPIPIEIDRAAARQSLQIPDGSPILLIAGTLDPRKSIHHMVEWASTTNMREPPRLLLAGAPSGTVSTLLRSTAVQQLRAAGRLLLTDRVLTDRELGLCYRAADVALLLYGTQGPSGGLGYAMQYGVPVLAWGNRFITANTRRLGLGHVLTTREPRAIEEGMRQVLSSFRGNGRRGVSSRDGRQESTPNGAALFLGQLTGQS
jgi:hypothetical protein